MKKDSRLSLYLEAETLKKSLDFSDWGETFENEFVRQDSRALAREVREKKLAEMNEMFVHRLNSRLHPEACITRPVHRSGTFSVVFENDQTVSYRAVPSLTFLFPKTLGCEEYRYGGHLRLLEDHVVSYVEKVKP